MRKNYTKCNHAKKFPKLIVLPTFQNPVFRSFKNSQNNHFCELFEHVIFNKDKANFLYNLTK